MVSSSRNPIHWEDEDVTRWDLPLFEGEPNRIGPSRRTDLYDTRTAIRLVETMHQPNPDPPHKLATDPAWIRASLGADLLGIVSDQPLYLNGCLVGSCSSTRRVKRL